MGARDSRMILQTFQGVWALIVPVKGLQLMATRINAFESRTSDGLTHDNLYYPNGYEGDTLYGTTTVFPKKTVLPEACGTSVVGARYHSGPIHGEAWFYDYTDFARSTYLNGGYAFGKAHDAFAPYSMRSSCTRRAARCFRSTRQLCLAKAERSIPRSGACAAASSSRATMSPWPTTSWKITPTPLAAAPSFRPKAITPRCTRQS